MLCIIHYAIETFLLSSYRFLFNMLYLPGNMFPYCVRLKLFVLDTMAGNDDKRNGQSFPTLSTAF